MSSELGTSQKNITRGEAKYFRKGQVPKFAQTQKGAHTFGQITKRGIYGP